MLMTKVKIEENIETIQIRIDLLELKKTFFKNYYRKCLNVNV